MVTPDPERPGKRHFTWQQSLFVIALLILVIAIAAAPWTPALPYR